MLIIISQLNLNIRSDRSEYLKPDQEQINRSKLDMVCEFSMYLITSKLDQNIIKIRSTYQNKDKKTDQQIKKLDAILIHWYINLGCI